MVKVHYSYYSMDFYRNKISVEVIRKEVFGGKYFRNIYSGSKGKQYRKSWKQFDKLDGIDGEYHSSDYYDIDKVWLNSIEPYGWFQQYFRFFHGRTTHDDHRKINIRKVLLVDLSVNWLK